MILSAIVAAGRRGEIGQGDGLPWPPLPDDRRWFRRVTIEAGLVIMGRRTWEMLPSSPLPRRVNVVLTQTWPGLEGPIAGLGCDVVKSVDAAVRAAHIYRTDEAVVMGGRRVYEAFWSRIGRLYVTAVAGEFPAADTHLPAVVPLLLPDRTGGPQQDATGVTWYKMAELVYERSVPHPLLIMTFERGHLLGLP